MPLSISYLFNPQNYFFSYYGVPVFLVGIYSFILGTYILDVRQRNIFGLKFFAACLCTSVWLVSIGFSFCSGNKELAQFWCKITMCAVAFIPFTQFSFNAEIAPRIKETKMYDFLFYGALVFSLVFSLFSLFSDLFVSDVRKFFWGYYPIVGPVGYLFVGFFGFLGFFTLKALHQGYGRSVSLRERARIKIMVYAVTIGYLASVDFIAVFGFSFYPFGYSFILVMISAWTYVAIRYHLMDITPQTAATETFAAMPSALIVTDLDGRIKLVNKRTCKLLGHNESDLLEKYLGKILSIPEEYLEVEKLLEKPILDDELDLTAGDGETHTISLSVSVIRNWENDPIGLSYVMLDVSRRKIAEQKALIAMNEVEASRDKLQHTIDELSGILSKIVSDKGLDLDTPQFVKNPLIPNCWELKNCNIKQCPAYGKVGIRCWHVVGTLCKEVVNVSFVRKLDTCIACEVFRISTTSQLYEIREAFNNMLQILINSERELINSREAAEKANKAKSEFLANMSHEIRTPMNGIIGMAEIGMSVAIDEKTRNLIKTISFEANLLNILLNDILDLSKIESGKMILENISFDLRQLMDNFSRSFSLIAEQNDINYYCFLSPDLKTEIIGDPTRLRQILTNLTGNAIKFTPEGGEILVKGEIEEQTDKEVTVYFEVTDTGIGIAAEKHSTIFESFTQEFGSTSREYGGTGLGTTISKQIVELMGGEIGLESEKGKGTTFWFRLTLQKGGNLFTTGPDKTILHGRNVLLVNDNNKMRYILNQYLASWGCSVSEAANASEALELCRSAQDKHLSYDMLVAEIKLEAMDGLELVKRVRQLNDNTDMMVIMTTLSGHRGDGERCQAAGVDGYLSNPFTYSDLYKTLIEVLELEGNELGRIESGLVTKHSVSDHRNRAFNILLVEDYPTNQKVAITHLKSFGCTVELAENGEQAVKAYLENNFDLVFMDVQMPVMDGLIATRTIREHEKSSGRVHVPIIAMTANAMKGDREKCIESGMDDYISKPLKKIGIADMIDRWATSGKNATHPSASPDCTETLTEPLHALPFDLDRAIKEYEGERGVVIEIIDEFLLDVRKQLETIARAIDESDAEIIRREAHSIKGGARNITAEPMADAAAALEDAGKSADMGNAGLALKKLEEEIDHFASYYRKAITGPP
ncbi:MAG: response regulator [Proteobacteria bacterium]|nr:response regulator [Pseudomonadota bacterium]MBU1708752.1 response regulator [Pseudomonadota bacterium]